jgi:hypothetical protein
MPKLRITGLFTLFCPSADRAVGGPASTAARSIAPLIPTPSFRKTGSFVSSTTRSSKNLAFFSGFYYF